MKYDAEIINRLLDKYEGSKQSYKEVNKTRVIRIIVENDKVFHDYWKDDSYKYRHEINEVVELLAEKNLVNIDKDYNTGLLRYIKLNLNNIDKAYDYVKRIKKTDLESKGCLVVEKYLERAKKGSVLEFFCNKMKRKLQERKHHKGYFEDALDLEKKCFLIERIENNEEETLLRNFSKKQFSDSKFLEKNAAYVFKIFNEFDSDYESFNDVCEKHFIIRNPGYVYLKNGLKFKINNQVIDLDELKEEFSLSDDAISKMEILSIEKKKILTIENLTTFHYFNDNSFVIIYLGGFHNTTKRRLIEKINRFNKQLDWFHFGDIDWGGIEILLNLRDKTKIDFKPYLMDISQLIKYKDECSKLTKNDRKKLFILAKTNIEFKELIMYMLDKNIKLEQESIKF